MIDNAPGDARSRYRRAVVVGVGLIGGSLALALRRRGLAAEVLGVDVDDGALDWAEAHEVVSGRLSLGDDARWAGVDLVVVCVPVGVVAATLAALGARLPATALITDVASTKRDVLAAAAALPAPERFVGAHPLAGTERSGVRAAQPELFVGRRCLLTPTATTARARLDEATALWQALGAEVVQLDAAAHDAIMARVSHLPHVVAFALAAAAGRPSAHRGRFAGLCGGGFVDTTRIAASDPVMWRDILLANRVEVLAALADFEEELDKLRAAVAFSDGDELLRAVERAHRGRARVLGDDAA